MDRENKTEALLELASDGNTDHVKAFFEHLFAIKLYVPERKQTYPLSNQPHYPTDLVHILGIQDGERVIVPVFSNPELISEWAGNEFSYLEVSAKELANKIPDEWWAILNPGSDIHKEFSPWEIAEIKLGDEGIAALVKENASAPTTPLEVKAESFESKPEFIETLKTYAAEKQEILAFFGLKESKEDTTTYMLGVEIESDTHRKHIQDELPKTIERFFIGDAKIACHVFVKNESTMHAGLLRNGAALYEREKPGGFLKGLKSIISGK